MEVPTLSGIAVMTSSASNFDRIRSTSLSDLVQEEILRGIKAGELTVGAKLNEIELRFVYASVEVLYEKRFVRWKKPGWWCWRKIAVCLFVI